MAARLRALGMAGVLAALALPGGAHHSAAAFSLSVSPYKITTSARHLSEPVRLTNRGTAPVTIVASFRTITGPAGPAAGACALSGPPSWASVRPADVTIRPGATRRVRIVVNAPASAGAADLAAVFSAAVPRSAQGTGLAVVGAVATRVEVGYGTAQAPLCGHHPRPVALRRPGGGGISTGAILAASALVALLAALAALLIWRRRGRQRTAYLRHPAHDRARHPHRRPRGQLAAVPAPTYQSGRRRDGLPWPPWPDDITEAWPGGGDHR